MTCACRLNAAETTILIPCALHAAWARCREQAQLEKLYTLFDAGEARVNAAPRKVGAR